MITNNAVLRSPNVSSSISSVSINSRSSRMSKGARRAPQEMRMLLRIAEHYVGIRQGSEKKYRILAELQRKGHTVCFDVLYYAQKTKRAEIEEEIGAKEGEFIRKHGLYDYVQINCAYSSSRMASNRLTRNQVESIFRKGKVRESFEPMKVSDLIEVMNHCVCMDYVLDYLEKPLSVKFIKMFHYLLTYGTVDARLERVTPGEYRNSLSIRKESFMAPADKINERLIRLIDTYERLDEVDRRDILDFHVQFERIFPFEDGNGRVGRLIMFKECLRHDVLPFILDDKRRKGYLTGLREWDEDPYILTEVILEAQERFSRQIALQDLGEHRLDDLNDFDEEDW